MVRILLGLSSARPLLNLIHRDHRLKLIPPQRPRNNRSNMSSNSAGGGGGGGGGGRGGGRDPSSNPMVAKLRQLITQDSSSTSADLWEKCWEEGVTPWDLGQATPVVLHLLQTGTLPKGRVLVPGCGTGYDVVAMASADRYVLGLDISSSAVRKAKEWSFSLPNANYFNFLVEDFFTWQPSELFDLVFDYTFFCAIDPSMRLSWAKKMSDILKPDGELLTLIYLMNDQESGPPHNNSVADYEEVLNLVDFTAVSIVDNELAIAPRRGKEKLASFDGNSLKVAELLFKGGFKEVYAIKGGLRGKDGCQAIQETLLPPSVQVYPRKKKSKSSAQLEKTRERTDDKNNGNGKVPSSSSIKQEGNQDSDHGRTKPAETSPEAILANGRPLSPYPMYPDLKPPSSPSPSKPQS